MDALDENGIFSVVRQKFHRARYEFAIPYVQQRIVADIASGLGYGCRIMNEHGAAFVIGIERSLQAVAYAQAHHQWKNVSYLCGDATTLPLRARSLDVITSFETIEHISNTTALLLEFKRVLKPEGLLIISSPNDWGLTSHHCHTWTPFEFMAEVASVLSPVSIWEQYSGGSVVGENRLSGIQPWRKDTEAHAECLIILATRSAM